MAEVAASTDAVPRRPGKSPEAFRTISEVAAELDVPQHVLRFWETKFTQIKPLKRGGGRRYYRPDDVDLLRRIRSLLYSEGYTIKGVQKVLRELGPKGLAEAPRATPETKSVAPEPPPRPASAPLFAEPRTGGLSDGQRAALQAALTELRAVHGQLEALAKPVV
jgi:DNA-binding transcriptional MerR regulator